jgi:hypothetical protein
MLVELEKRGKRMALAHYDFGFGVKELDVQEGGRLSPLIRSLMVDRGLVVSQQPLLGFEQINGPDTIEPGRYRFYRAA